MSQSRRSSLVEVSRQKDDIVRVNDDVVRRMSQSHANIGNDINEARQATEREHNASVRDSLKLYKKAIAFSLILSTAVIMEGYDMSLMGSFLGFPPFEERYGIVSEKFGYKKTMMGALVLMIAFIFLPFFAQNLETILAGAILQGVPWGIFQTLTVTYASEVTPTNLRAYLTTYVNLCWVIGQLIAAGVLRGFLERTDQWAYRIPFAIQWVWPVPILVGTILAPESPWWLVRQGRYEDAKKSIHGLVSLDSGIPFNVEEQISLIRATNELEKANHQGTSYLDCFRGTDLRRTEIACVAWLAQAFCGAALMGYSVQFYERAGLDPSNSFNFNIGQYAMGFVGTVGSWFLMRHIGRRTLYIWGLAIMFSLLMVIGGLGFVDSSSAGWGVGSLLLVYTFVYDITVGPVCYSIVAEIPSTRLKVKCVALARNVYNLGGIVNNVIMPRMIGVNAWNLGSKSAWVYAVCCFVLLNWTYFRMPEAKDRTYGELEVLFENKVSARKFHKTRVDQFSGDNTDIIETASTNGSSIEEEKEKQNVVTKQAVHIE